MLPEFDTSDDFVLAQAGGSAPSATGATGKIKIRQPGPGHPFDEFCQEVAGNLESLFTPNWNKETLVYSLPSTWSSKSRAYQIVNPADGCLWCVKAGVVGRIVVANVSQGLEKICFAPFKPEEFVTAFDEYFIPLKKTGGLPPEKWTT